MSEQRRSQLHTHLLRMAVYVAFFMWLAFVWGAIKVVSMSGVGKYSLLRAWTVLFVCTVIIISTMNYWVRYLRIILGGAVLGGVLITMSGQLLNGKPFPRPIAALITVLLVCCGVVSNKIAYRELSMPDRVAMLLFVAAFMAGFVKDTPIANLLGAGVGLVCLLTSWLTGYRRLIR